MSANRHRAGLFAATFLLSGISWAMPASAANVVPFRITGALTQIAGEEDFTGAAVRRVTAEQQSVAFSFVQYWVLDDPSGTDHYAFTLEATSSAPVAATELAFDPAGHRQLLAVGIPTSDSMTKLLGTKLAGSASGIASSTLATDADGGAGTLALTRGHDFFGTFWTDPLGITVNDVVDEAKFYYDGAHVSSLQGYDARQWLSGNGWHEVHHSIAQGYNTARTLGWVQTNDRFQTSSWFPFPTCGTTDVYYSVNRVYAQPDGHPSGDVTTWQTGACGFLLSYIAMAFRGT